MSDERGAPKDSLGRSQFEGGVNGLSRSYIRLSGVVPTMDRELRACLWYYRQRRIHD
jgi:hypothetical protein